MKKEIRCLCYEPIAKYPNYKQVWSDVWVRFKSKPGRKLHMYGPTLLTLEGVVEDLKMYKELQERYPESEYWEEIKWCDDIISWFKETKFNFYVDDSKKNGMPDIITRKEYIDKEEAEKMLAYWLSGWFGMVCSQEFQDLKFIWNKPKILVTPT